MWERKFKMKLCLLGDGGVGKTSLIRRFVFNEFDERYLYTLGTNVSKKEVFLDETDEGAIMASLMIWDIMGQRSFMPLLQGSYFEGANGGLAVCDVSRGDTLESLRSWINAMQSVAGIVPLVILVNKSDLLSEREIAEEDALALGEEFDAPVHFTSAKTGESVEESFKEIALQILQNASVDVFAANATPETDAT